MRQGTRKIAKTAGLAMLCMVAVTGAYASFAVYSSNFATVIPGEVYRSAQPSAQAITRFAHDYGIRAIVNLRGANPGTAWYDKEVATAKALGIRHIDFAMSAKTILTPERARELTALLANAPKPLLIHCQAGADRSGLAAALYVASVAKQGEEAAESQISLRYGHISLPFIPAYAMDRSWDALEPLLGYKPS